MEHVHQTDSKRSAGLEECAHTNDAMLLELYPWGLTDDLPLSSVNSSVWCSDETEASRHQSNGEHVQLLSAS